MSSFAEIAQKQDQRKRAADLSLAAMASRGEPDAVKKLLKEWSE